MESTWNSRKMIVFNGFQNPKYPCFRTPGRHFLYQNPELSKSSQKVIFIAINVCHTYTTSRSCYLVSRPRCDIIALTMLTSRPCEFQSIISFIFFLFFKIPLNPNFLPLVFLKSFLPHFSLAFANYSSDFINFTHKFYVMKECHQVHNLYSPL